MKTYNLLAITTIFSLLGCGSLNEKFNIRARDNEKSADRGCAEGITKQPTPKTLPKEPRENVKGGDKKTQQPGSSSSKNVQTVFMEIGAASESKDDSVITSDPLPPPEGRQLPGSSIVSLLNNSSTKEPPQTAVLVSPDGKSSQNSGGAEKRDRELPSDSLPSKMLRPTPEEESSRAPQGGNPCVMGFPLLRPQGISMSHRVDASLLSPIKTVSQPEERQLPGSDAVSLLETLQGRQQRPNLPPPTFPLVPMMLPQTTGGVPPLLTLYDILYDIYRNPYILSSPIQQRLPMFLPRECVMGSTFPQLLELLPHVQRGMLNFVKSTNADTGDTMLHYCAAKNDLEGVMFLVRNGADVNAQNKQGRSPLHSAVLEYKSGANYRILYIVQYLIAHGANIFLKDINGNTIFHYAIMQGVSFICEVPENQVVNFFKVKNKLGQTVLHMAVNARTCENNPFVFLSFIQVLKKLTQEQRSEIINLKDIRDKTALHDVIQYHNFDDDIVVEIVRHLVENGANINAKDKQGITPLQLAAGNKKIRELLRKHGAKE